MKIINLSRLNMPPAEGDWIKIIHPEGMIEEKEYHYTPPEPETLLQITLPEVGVVGTQFNINVKVVFEDGSLVPVSTSYYVPIVRSADNAVISYHHVGFVNGEANVLVTPMFCGKLTLRLDLIEPKPTAKLPAPPYIHILSE